MVSALVLACTSAPFFRFTVTQEKAVLGRSSQADFVVNDSTISRKHAELRVDDGKLHFADLGSRNGIFLNERKTGHGTAEIGQIVRFGSIAFVVSAEGDSEIEISSEDATEQPTGDQLLVGPASEAAKQLSDAQRRVFTLLLTGMQEKTIANQLKLSIHTVHNHVKAIFRRLEVHSRAELLAKFVRKPSK